MDRAMIERFVRILNGKRAGMVAKVVSEDERWIFLEVWDWGEPINYFKNQVQELDASKVTKCPPIPYMGKMIDPYMWEYSDD